MYDLLSKGVEVLKHGRAGRPKRRSLYCDAELSELYWRPFVAPNASGAGFLSALYERNRTNFSRNSKDRSLKLRDILEVSIFTIFRYCS
jgi:hypothetical protein